MTRNVVIIDDIIGQVEEWNSPSHPQNFRAMHETHNLKLHFASAHDDFLRRYDSGEALHAVRQFEFQPALVLVDLLFGDGSDDGRSSYLGLAIIELLHREMPDIPLALFTTISRNDRATGYGGNTVGAVLDANSAGYLNKDEAFSSGFSAAVVSYLDQLTLGGR